jgi:hypothetical protein
MSKSLIRKNQLDSDVSDLVKDYGSNFFVSLEAPSPFQITGSGNQELKGVLTAQSFLEKNPLNFFDSFKTGQITVGSGLGPFERKVYTTNLGVLNNSDETIVFFSYTGQKNDWSKNQLFHVFMKSNAFDSTVQVTEGSHVEPLISSSVTNYGIARINFAGSIPGNSSLATKLGMLETARFAYLYVNKDYKKTYTNGTIVNAQTRIPSGDPPVLAAVPGNIGNLYAYPTGVTYGDMENQYLKGFLVGVYGVSTRSQVFNLNAATTNPITGCAIIFEGAWLEDGQNNTTNLNLAFVNYGPSGIGSAGPTANTNSLTLYTYIID